MSYLAREQSHPEVYVIVGNQKFWIPTPAALFAMGYSWSDVQVVPDGSLANLTLITADSVAATPPSLVFPPDNATKWYAVSTPISKQITSGGQNVSLTELRGWLRMVGGGCNGGDPDWHYRLEVDPDWCDSMSIDLQQILKVGNILEIAAPFDPVSTAYATVSVPCINLELNGWPDTHHPNQFLPQDWSVTNEAGCPGAIWAYDPLHPNPADAPLPVSTNSLPVLDPVSGSAPYVKVTGSLVTDEPHTASAQIFTWLAREFNIINTTEDEARAVRQAWDSRASSDPQDVARWTEMHPVDGIWILEKTKMPRYTLRGVAVLARSGLFVGDQQALDLDIYPPGPRPPNMQAMVQESVGPETNYSTIIEGNTALNGAQISYYGDHVHIHVKVQGQGGWGAPGTFKALYRVYWETIPPKKKEKEKEKDHKEKERKEKDKDRDSSRASEQPSLLVPPTEDTPSGAGGQAFIQPEERPNVGDQALNERE